MKKKDDKTVTVLVYCELLEQSCTFGFTKVCTQIPEEGSLRMSLVCPNGNSNRNGTTKEPPMCSCFSVRSVEQALAEGISPFGKTYEGCVYLDYDLVFPNVNGMISLFDTMALILMIL